MPAAPREEGRVSAASPATAFCDEELLADVITRIVNGHPQPRLDELMPWVYPPHLMPQLQIVA